MEQDSPKIGIYPSYTRETYSIGESFSLAVTRTGQTIVAMLSGLYDMIRGTTSSRAIWPCRDFTNGWYYCTIWLCATIKFCSILSINLGLLIFCHYLY